MKRLHLGAAGSQTARRGSRIGKKLQHVATIEARTADEAIEEAAKLFRVEPALRDKLMATEATRGK